MKQTLKATAAILGMVAACGLALSAMWLILWLGFDAGMTM